MNAWLEARAGTGPTSARSPRRARRCACACPRTATSRGRSRASTARSRRPRARRGRRRRRSARSREKAAKSLAKAAAAGIAGLGFAKAQFQVSITDTPGLGPTGDCGCEFLFSPNVGEAPLPLSRIASSGELARVMLALKAVLADLDSVPVLVFDEVDANVGGEIGSVVGERMAAIARRHQVLCVTHLPQVAAHAAQPLRGREGPVGRPRPGDHRGHPRRPQGPGGRARPDARRPEREERACARGEAPSRGLKRGTAGSTP